MKRRWVKFRGRAPRFHDPAEAEFDVKLCNELVIPGCFWSMTIDGISESGATGFTGFHTIAWGQAIPIMETCITHYRIA